MRIALVLLLPAVVACEFGEKDAKVPGEPLGTYHVVAALEDSTCGPGALGATDLWEFEVKLSREARDFYWLNGKEVIFGTIAADDVTFAFDTRIDVQAIPPGKGQPGCAISRKDSATGKLSSASDDVKSFDGLLRYGFVPKTGSNCEALVGVEGGFSALPCEMSYEMNAARTKTE
jgi:hypothetical protein